MSRTFATVGQVKKALEKRGCYVHQGHVVSALNRLDMHPPMDESDIGQLLAHIQPKALAVDRRVRKIANMLLNDEFKRSVIQARLRLGIPEKGLAEEGVRGRHDALFRELFEGETTSLTRDQPDLTPSHFWGKVVIEALDLCPLLSIDPTRLNRLADSFRRGSGDPLLGLRKILNPEGILKVGGKERSYEPTQTDRLMGHLLWGLILLPDQMSPVPAVTYSWEQLSDGRGRFIEIFFQVDNASSSELKELALKMREIKRDFRRQLLLSLKRSGTWNETWKLWNRKYPDFYFPTPGALRKTVAYNLEKQRHLSRRIRGVVGAQPAPGARQTVG